MAIPTRIEGDVYVHGNLSATTMAVPDSVVTNAKVSPSADIDATKLEHQYQPVYAQPNTTATAETKAVHVVYGTAGTIVAVAAGAIAANIGAAACTVDLKKNGTTCLSAPISVGSGTAAYISVAGSLTVTTLAAGDVLTVVTTATAGGGTLATGLFARVVLHEDAQ